MMKPKPVLFDPQTTYQLLYEMMQAVDLGIPRRLIGKNQTLTCTKEHLYVCIVREGSHIPYLAIKTRTARPTTLISVKFEGSEIRVQTHPHLKIGVGELPTDWSFLHALKLYKDMQDGTERYFSETMGIQGFHEIFSGIRKTRLRQTHKLASAD